MSKHRFTYYMHGSKDTWREAVEDAIDQDLSEYEQELIVQAAQFPFYEIGFDCELDTETGVVSYEVIRP